MKRLYYLVVFMLGWQTQEKYIPLASLQNLPWGSWETIHNKVSRFFGRTTTIHQYTAVQAAQAQTM